MRIDVAELEPGQVVRSPFREVIASRSDDAVFDEAVVGEVEIERTVRTLWLRGRVETTAPMACGRCLVPYRQRLSVALDEEFSLEAPQRTAPRGELGREDFVLPLPEMVLDVSDIIRQHLVLAVPMVPLCSPDCRGLCPQCGANLNEHPGHHHDAPSDPRLASLLNFREQGNEGTRERGKD